MKRKSLKESGRRCRLRRELWRGNDDGGASERDWSFFSLASRDGTTETRLFSGERRSWKRLTPIGRPMLTARTTLPSVSGVDQKFIFTLMKRSGLFDVFRNVVRSQYCLVHAVAGLECGGAQVMCHCTRHAAIGTGQVRYTRHSRFAKVVQLAGGALECTIR